MLLETGAAAYQSRKHPQHETQAVRPEDYMAPKKVPPDALCHSE